MNAHASQLCGHIFSAPYSLCHLMTFPATAKDGEGFSDQSHLSCIHTSTMTTAWRCVQPYWGLRTRSSDRLIQPSPRSVTAHHPTPSHKYLLLLHCSRGMEPFPSSPATVRAIRSSLSQFARKHPRVVACALSTLLLGAVSVAVLLSNTGLAFASMIPVMSGIQFIDDVLPADASSPGVSHHYLILTPLTSLCVHFTDWIGFSPRQRRSRILLNDLELVAYRM